MREPLSRQALAVLLFVLAVGCWFLAVQFDSPPYVRPSDQVWAVSFMAFPVVGLLVAYRVPRNPVGWLFMIGPGLIGLGVAFQEMQVRGVGDAVFFGGIAALLASFLLFPDGRYPSRAWTVAHVAVLAAWIAALGLHFLGLAEIGGAVFALNLALPLAALVTKAVRGDATLRRQLAWPLTTAVLGLIFAVVLGGVFEGSEWAGALAPLVLTLGLPAAVGLSILRYHLFDIDRIVSRTVSYGLVVGVLAAVYVGGLTVLTTVFPPDSPLAVAGATLAVAAVFNPVRRRILAGVDRRFHRSRYDIETVVEEFAGSLQDRVDPTRVRDGWVDVVASTMQPRSLAVWVRADDEDPA